MTRQSAVRAIVAMAMLMAFTCACGSPTSPTPPSASSTPIAPTPPPTLTGLSITQMPTTIVVGSRMQLQANARFSDGSIQPVAAEWVASAPIVEVAPGGVLVARAAGSATVAARYQGFEARSGVFIVADYSGTWRGGWRRLECFGPRCREGDFANPAVELLIAQHDSLGLQMLSGVMSFGPWNETRYVLAGRGNLSSASSASLFLFWIERGPQGERVREISLTINAITIDAAQTLSARASMMLREGEEMTRLEFALENLNLISRTVRA